ncbi:MAG: hypothetical protein PHR30_09390 [Gallionellaceae bacterium]|nr:hypothetical protein [Gallionellaceae bacterium]MDD5365540.1 hypothetical protein [Gallionellaceae bacterium]
MQKLILPGMIALLTLPACSAEQVYATGRNWQRQECAKLADLQERERCQADADQPYNAYKREADTVQGQP